MDENAGRPDQDSGVSGAMVSTTMLYNLMKRTNMRSNNAYHHQTRRQSTLSTCRLTAAVYCYCVHVRIYQYIS
eukprot:1345476-Amorphochlora_amoeboformis.AAC.1